MKTAQPNQLPSEVGLTADEAARVRELLGREPNALEWAMFGAMWSEHCAYKHSKKLLRTLPTRGRAVALGAGENAGAVDLGEGLLCVFKVESHNHPSAIEPYQGAATGVGGILRDIFAMGARPTAVLNALFFGPPSDPAVRRTIAGVTGGISFYGNCVGIPDVAGHISFEACYAENPLVNAMCVGIARASDIRKASGARPGSAVYLVGSDTGRDGIAGASLLASFELGGGEDAKRPSVQVGNPFLEKLLLEATPEYDISELARSYAALDEAPLVLTGPRLREADLPTRDRPPLRASDASSEPRSTTAKIGLELLELLASPAVASRRLIYRTYDQLVGTDTVVGPGADAAVMRIKGRADGIAVAIDAQPRLAALDPYVGAAAAVAEATRNIVCVGATPLAISDCLNLGNPDRPKGAHHLERTVAGVRAACEAPGVPVVSGNVSLYNATRGVDIWPTAVIGAVGHLADVTNYIPPTSGRPGDIVLLVGNANVSAGPSAYGAQHEMHEGPVGIDLALESRLQRLVLEAHERGAIRAAHDRDAGGLGVALAALAIRDGIGMKVTLPAIRGIDRRVALFGEGPSAIVLVIDPAREVEVRTLARERDIPVWTLGAVGGDLLEVVPVLGMPVASLVRAHADGLGRALGRTA